MTRRILLAGGILALSIAPAGSALGASQARDHSRVCNPDICVVPAAEYNSATPHRDFVYAVPPHVDAGVPSPPLLFAGTPVSAYIPGAPVDGAVSARGPPASAVTR